MKRSHIIAIVLIAVAIGAILGTVADSSTYATFNMAIQNPGKEYHVVGQLNKEKEMIYDPMENVNLFSFYIFDKDSVEKKVNFNGTKPQDFEKSEQIVLTGKMEDGEFTASKILMKCPSKYNDGKQDEFREFKSEG